MLLPADRPTVRTGSTDHRHPDRPSLIASPSSCTGRRSSSSSRSAHTSSRSETTTTRTPVAASSPSPTWRDRTPTFSTITIFRQDRRHRGLSVNDPSAGSPTETLLRLLLPLDRTVQRSSRHAAAVVARPRGTNPNSSLNDPIGSSDGRCVQRAGT